MESSGSPPHGRGKAAYNLAHLVSQRITPAWAGKRGRCCPDRLRCWDHPRAGREEQTGTVYAVLPYGSPPHGRGKGEQEKTPCAREGITPAWAGKSGSRAVRPSPAGDHPRVGGEKLTTCGTRSLEMGSPPHRRGKENRVRVTGLNLRITPARRGKGPMPFLSSPSARITPAWAGKSEIRPVSFHFHRDHPRTGGEKAMLAIRQQ